MPFVPAVNVCAVEMVYSMQGQFVENVFHVQFPAPPTPTSMAVVAAQFVLNRNLQLKLRQVAEALLVKVRVTDLTTIIGTGIEYTTGLPVAGTNAGAASPMNVTVAVKWATGFRGRSFRGRTYHIGLPQTFYLDSTLTPSAVTQLQSDYNNLILDVAALTGGYSLVVLSRISGKAPRITATASIITSCSVDATLDSQRRRLPGRGR